MIKYFDALPSTNQYCELLDLNKVEEFTCFCALAQTAGIGQRGNHWEAQPGQNLTFSLVLHPKHLMVVDQFKLTQCLSVAVCDWLSKKISPQEIKIKWPNDIYVGARKICGMLISIKVSCVGLSHAICGIGLNINQTLFPEWVPNPISLKQITGEDYDIKKCLEELIESVRARYEEILMPSLQEAYLARLFRNNEPGQYIYKDQLMAATIVGINHYGQLLLQPAEGEVVACNLKEVQYVL